MKMQITTLSGCAATAPSPARSIGRKHTRNAPISAIPPWPHSSQDQNAPAVEKRSTERQCCCSRDDRSLPARVSGPQTSPPATARRSQHCDSCLQTQGFPRRSREQAQPPASCQERVFTPLNLIFLSLNAATEGTPPSL